MVGIKRKDAPHTAVKSEKKVKVGHSKSVDSKRPAKVSHLEAAARQNDEDGDDDGEVAPRMKEKKPYDHTKPKSFNQSNDGSKQFKLETSSAEAHAKQRALAKERRAAKPNADAIQRAKKLWEQLRRKSHVPRDERKKLVAELFELIDGRVRDFVFKHDSVRVVQCAIKYANADQLKIIVKELKGDTRDLVESRYGKFLVAKMVVQGDREDKDLMIPEFYGHVKRLINHPEASWIVDDIYRQVATPQQKAMLLREWYGPEFALFGKDKSNARDESVHADLAQILEESPEKRRPILQYLHQMINNLVQKKMTGFTMLHDAMLQYFLALTPGSSEHSEFLDTLKGDIDAEEEGGGGDLYRNLSFTKNGSRLVSLALAYGNAKDRKVILKCFKDHIEAMAFDQYAKMVLATALEVLDDTRNAHQAILRDLLGTQIQDETERYDRLQNMVIDLNSRLPLLLPLSPNAKWLVKDQEKALIDEVRAIRSTTSLKDPSQRRKELLGHMSDFLLNLVAQRAETLTSSSFGCQAVTTILLECSGDHRIEAKNAVANLAAGDLDAEDHVARNPAASRMLKSLVLGGPFDPTTKQIQLVEPRLGFAASLYPIIQPQLVKWACGDSSFVVVGLLESEDVDAKVQKEVKATLQKESKKLKAAAEGKGDKKASSTEDEGGKKVKKIDKGNAGSKILLEKIM